MTLYITGAESFVEPGLDVVGVYNIHGPSGNRYLAGMPAHTHLKLTIPIQATLTHRSLRSSRRSIRNGCKKSQKGCQHVLWQNNPPKNRAKRAKKGAVERILWRDCMWRASYKRRVDRCMSDWADLNAVESHTYIAARRRSVVGMYHIRSPSTKGSKSKPADKYEP